MLSVFGVGSRFTPPCSVPPLSSTWNVNVVYGLPFASATGSNVRFAMSATAMNWSAATATPLSFNVPAAGNDAIFTRLNALTGMSFGSVKPKSAEAKVYVPSSSMVTVLSVPAGASFTSVTRSVIQPSSVAVPSLTRTRKV